MEVIVDRIKDSTFAARGDTGHWVVMDTRKEFGGSEGASSPMEMVLMGLGGCTGIDVQTILQKMRVEVDHFSIRIAAERAAEHPKVFTRIHMIFAFRGMDLDEEKIHKAVHLSHDKYCSVSAMLSKTAEFSFEIQIFPK